MVPVLFFFPQERDFDMHAKYCQDEPKAQELLATAPVKEYFEVSEG